MYLNETLQTWFCFFHKFLKIKWDFFSGSYYLNKFFIVKVEQIISSNGFFAAEILLYPQKFVSMIRYVDKIIQIRKNFHKKFYNLNRKTLILFDHFFEKFPNIFSNKFSIISSTFVGRLIFVKGTVVKEGSILIKKYKKKLIKNKKNSTEIFQSNYFKLDRFGDNDDFILKSETHCSGIEFQNIKILTGFDQLHLNHGFRLMFINISLIGGMTTLYKIGKNITLWGIIRRKVEVFPRITKNLMVNLSIEAVSIFLKKITQSNVKNLSKKISPFIDFLLFSQDSKLKGNDQLFSKRLFSKFLSKQFSEFFKTAILFSLIGGYSKKSLIKLKRESINICFLQNFFGSQYNLFFQIRKFLKNSLYFLTYNDCKSKYFLCGQKINLFSKKKKNLAQLLRSNAFFFIDFIDLKSKKKWTLINSLFYKKLNLFFYRTNKFKIIKPFSLFAILKLPQFLYNIHLFKNCNISKFKKLFLFFDILICFQDHILNSNCTFIPLFFPLNKLLRKKNSKALNAFLERYDFKSFSNVNITKYLSFLRSFKAPQFSSGAEKILILWYLTENYDSILKNCNICHIEKLVKFSQTSTKLYDRDIILVEDTILAISFLEKLCFKFNILGKTDSLSIKSYTEIEIENHFILSNKNVKLFKNFKPMLGTNLCNGNILFNKI